MRFHLIDKFSEVGGATLPSTDTIVAVGIAPSSEVDTCIVGAHVLGPESLVPYASTVRALRGFRSGPAIGSADWFDGGGVAADPNPLGLGTNLVLALYEKCDVLVPPGPRATVLREAALVADNGNALLAFRLPVAGRRLAHVKVRADDGAPVTFLADLHIYGVSYLGPTTLKTNPGERAFFELLFTDSLTAAELAKGVHVLLGQPPKGVATAVAELAYDELEVWVQATADEAPPRRLFVCGEASGERGR
jgi:hypothetical protein